jgi:hypothetical protein
MSRNETVKRGLTIMTKAQTILASVAAIALLPAAAFAGQGPSIVLNGQVQMGDAISQLNVHVGSTHGATASSVGVGNVMNAHSVQRDMTVTSNQTLQGRVGAFNDVAIGTARGATVSTAVAQGNAGQVVGCCSNTVTSASQVANHGTTVGAVSQVRVGSSDTVVSAAQAAANNFAISTANGTSRSFVGQYSAADVQAHSNVTACCNNDSLTSSALVAANSLAVRGESSTVYADLEQKNYGRALAASRVNVGSGTNVTSAASAAGNTALVDNRWGYAQMNGYQENRGFVGAISEVSLGDWRGHAVSGSNAVGNSAMLSNLGSDATIGMVQNNYSGVAAYTGLYGTSSQGGVGVASSHAVGNAVTGYACASCGNGSVKIEGYTAQYNYAPVTATTNISVGSAGHITGSATAVGNSASFIATRGGH